MLQLVCHGVWFRCLEVFVLRVCCGLVYLGASLIECVNGLMCVLSRGTLQCIGDVSVVFVECVDEGCKLEDVLRVSALEWSVLSY